MGTKNKVIGVDIDGVIAKKTGVRRYDFQNFVPIKKNIYKINQLYKKGFVIIYYTSRSPRYYGKTYSWLIKHRCDFHALRMGKMRADYYLDDHNETLDNLL